MQLVLRFREVLIFLFVWRKDNGGFKIKYGKKITLVINKEFNYSTTLIKHLWFLTNNDGLINDVVVVLFGFAHT